MVNAPFRHSANSEGLRAQAMRAVMPLTLAAVALAPAVVGGNGLDPEREGTVAHERFLPSGTAHESPDAQTQTSAEYDRVQGLFSDALKKDECVIKVGLDDVMAMYRSMFPDDRLDELSTDDFVTKASEIYLDFAKAREASGTQVESTAIKRLGLDSSKAVPELPISDYLYVLRESAQRWGIEIVTDWQQDKSDKSGYMNNAIEPLGAYPTSSRAVIMSLITELETMPPELNKPAVVSKIVLGNIVAENIAGQMDLRNGHMYVDVILPQDKGYVEARRYVRQDVLAHEAAHVVTTRDCGSTETDKALEALKPRGFRYLNVDVSVPGFYDVLARAVATNAAGSLESDLRYNSSLLRLGLIALTPSPLVATAEDYGANTPYEEQATGYASMLNKWGGARAVYSTRADTIYLRAGMALMAARTNKVNPRMAGYIVASMKTARVSAEVDRRQKIATDSTTQQLLTKLSSVDSSLRQGQYGYGFAKYTLRDTAHVYKVSETGQCFALSQGEAKGAAT